MPAFVALLALSAWCAYTDLRRRRIGNLPCVLGLAAGLAWAWWHGGYRAVAGPDLRSALVCVAMGFFPFWMFYRAGAVGSGEVKLMTAVGALCANPFFFLHVLMYTALAGVPVALIVCRRHGRFWSGLGGGLAAIARFRYLEKTDSGGKPDTPTRLPAENHVTAATPVESPSPPDLPTSSRRNIIKNTSTDITGNCDDNRKSSLTIPYAPAILAGVLIALGVYWLRGLPNPFG